MLATSDYEPKKYQGVEPNEKGYWYVPNAISTAAVAFLKEYLNYVRLKHAQTALLTTNSSITDITLEYGFNDSNYFNDLFKKVYGKSPREYRKNPD